VTSYGASVLKVSLWILTVLLNTINNAEGAFEWIREASVMLIKLSRERDRWNERFRRKRYDIRNANCGCQQKYTHIHTAGDVTVYVGQMWLRLCCTAYSTSVVLKIKLNTHTHMHLIYVNCIKE